MLSRPRHLCKVVQPLPRAVYRSCHHDEHNYWLSDSNQGPLTPLSDALSLDTAILGEV